MRRTFRWTPEADAILIRMRNARAGWDEISRALGSSVKSAVNHATELRATGVHIWTPLPRHDSLKTPANLDTVRRAILEGQSYCKAAALVGVSPSTAAKWSREMGIRSTSTGTATAPTPDLPGDVQPKRPDMRQAPITRGVSGVDSIPPFHPWSYAAVEEPWDKFHARLFRGGGDDHHI